MNNGGMMCASVLMLVLAGCAGGKPTAAPPRSQSPVPVEAPLIFTQMQPSSEGGRDPRPDAPIEVLLDIYQIMVPKGSISHKEEFWKRVDEHCVDVACYDLLYRNGVRVGVAPRREWDFFRSMIEGNTLRSERGVFRGGAGTAEIEISKELPGQDLFYYDADNVLIGRTFDRCQNTIRLAFSPVPRNPGTVRVKLLPVVRTSRIRLEYSLTNDERELNFVNPESLYDLRLEADVPNGSFLIIAPSPEGRWPTSIGNIFFLRDGHAERLERIILIVPRLYQLDEKRTAMAGAPKKTTRN